MMNRTTAWEEARKQVLRDSDWEQMYHPIEFRVEIEEDWTRKEWAVAIVTVITILILIQGVNNSDR